MRSETQLESKRALEALRAGVPNRDAVRALGCSQPAIEERFKKQLEATQNSLSQETSPVGTLIAGDFGTGKSHLLEYLQHIALQNNFVCSKVVISRETPLYDPEKVYTAAIRSAKLPDRTGEALTEIAIKLGDFKFNNPEYAEFFKWVNRHDNGLSTLFAATVFIIEKALGRDPELTNTITSFWSGNPIEVKELKSRLKELGQGAAYRIVKVKAKELVAQRYSFIPQLMVAAGYAGWVMLFDEIELIGRYGIKGRTKSYMQIARLMGKLEGENMPGLTTVLSIAEDFEGIILEGRNDEEKVPNKLRAGGSDAELLLASQAEQGMRIIRRDKMRLEKPTDTLIREIYNKVRSVYTTAYGWDPPEDNGDYDKSARLRQHIKKWINAWDLIRLYPGYKPEIQVTELKQDYSEMPEIEQLSNDGVDEADVS